MLSTPAGAVQAGAIFAFLGVALGAFGAHALQAQLGATGYAQTYETAVRYQMYHAIGLILAGLQASHMQINLQWIAWLFVAGILFFSGSLYVLSLSGIKWLGAITPLGGLCFLAGWALLAWQVGRGR